MNKQTDFKIGKTYRVSDVRPADHCFKPGSKVTVLAYPKEEDTWYQPDIINCKGYAPLPDGPDTMLDQWLKPDQLIKPKTWRKELLRADGAVYLVRYTLLRLPFLKIRLHHILLSDTECPHDHPWSFGSFILRGGYKEYREYREYPDPMDLLDSPAKLIQGVRYNWHTDKWTSELWHGPGSLLIRKATDIHRLELLPGKTCWTLVFMGRYKRPVWGFWKKSGKFVPHEKYEFTQSCDE